MTYIQNIGPEFCVQGCDIAQGPKARGLYHIRGHKTRVLYFVYKSTGVLYTIYGTVNTSFILPSFNPPFCACAVGKASVQCDFVTKFSKVAVLTLVLWIFLHLFLLLMDTNSPPEKKRRLSLSKKPDSRFVFASTEALEIASKKAIPKNTTVALNWAVRLFEAWIDFANKEEEQFCVEDLWSNKDASKLATMLSRFCLEVKQQNGNPYTPKSVLQILINLQNYARAKDTKCFNFMNSKDERLKKIHTVLDNLSQKLHWSQ